MDKRLIFGIIIPVTVILIVVATSMVEWQTPAPYQNISPQQEPQTYSSSGMFSERTRSAAYFDGKIYEGQYSGWWEPCVLRVFNDDAQKSYSHDFMTGDNASCGASGVAFWQGKTTYVYLQQYLNIHELRRYRYEGPNSPGTYVDSTFDDSCINHIAVDQEHATLWKSTCFHPGGEELRIYALPRMQRIATALVPGCVNGGTDVWVGADSNMHVLCTTHDDTNVMVYESTASSKEGWVKNIYNYTIPLDGTCGTATPQSVCNYPHFTDPNDRSRLMLIDHTNTRTLKERRYSMPSLTTGLVAYYPEDMRDTHRDAANGHDGEVIGEGITFVDGRLGGAYHFKGAGYNNADTSNDARIHAILPQVHSWPASAISMWAYFEPQTIGGSLLSFNEAEHYSHRYLLREHNGSLHLYIGDGNNGETGLSSAIVSTGAWHHIVGQWDMQHRVIALYIDGTLAGTKTFERAGAVSNDLYWGGGVNGFGPDVLIDEVGVWNRTLSEAEVKALYNNGHGRAYLFS